MVLGTAPEGAKVHPCLEFEGEIPDLLDQLGADGVVQLMVEGGPRVAHAFHHPRLVDEYIVYIAPALFAGGDAAGLFVGSGAMSIEGIWRGRFDDVTQLGADLRITLLPEPLLPDTDKDAGR